MRAIQTVWRTIKSWSCKRPRAIKPMFSIPRPHTYTWEDKQARVLDPEGLASMNLGTQDLKTRVKDALNLSCGLAWWKCRFKWEVFKAQLEPCLKIATQEEERVLPLAKRQQSPEGLREEPTQASRDTCRGPTQEALEACPRSRQNPLEKEPKNPSIKRGLVLGSLVFMPWERLWTPDDLEARAHRMRLARQ